MVRKEAVLDSWKAIRQDTAQAVEDLPAGELDFRPTPELMTFAEIARHILDAGYALTGLMLDGVDDMATPKFREMIRNYVAQLPETPDATSLASELRKAADQRCAELAQKDDAFFSGIITRFDGQKVTRLEMMQMVKEHELTHRSQLFVYLRLKGIVPATTRRRMAAQQQKAG